VDSSARSVESLSSVNLPGALVEERWVPWPVYWGAVWVGVLAALAGVVIFSLVGVAAGAEEVGRAAQITKWSTVGIGALIFGVCVAFFAFVIGGWVTAKVAGIRRAEAASLHGAVTWLTAMPFLILLLALGVGNTVGWFGGIVGTPVWAVPGAIVADPNAAAIARNTTLAAVTAALMGLAGAVLGGWSASGEPMSVRYVREDNGQLLRQRPHAERMRRA
jgi:hypothetical protein